MDETSPKTGGISPASRCKRELRASLIRDRDALLAEARAGKDDAITRCILENTSFLRSAGVLLYCPVGSEINVFPLLQVARSRGIPVGFPVCIPETRTLKFLRLFPNMLMRGGLFGIPVPPPEAPEMDLSRDTFCVVPALAYDARLHRLGYGGGYYDRFLAAFPGVSAGVAYRENLLATVYAEEHDIPVSVLATDSGLILPKY